MEVESSRVGGGGGGKLSVPSPPSSVVPETPNS